MLEFARLPENDRRDVFRETAGQMRVNEAIIEKDFWVCWILKYLFEKSRWNDLLMFKGGTSLSKAYGVIKRFSEDIDLILDWRELGYSEEDLTKNRSRTQQDSFNVEANKRCGEFLSNDFAPALRHEFRELAGSDEIDVTIDDFNHQCVSIRYPKSFSLRSIRPEIILEIGPLAKWTPNNARTITPYAVRVAPRLFIEPDTTVPTITAERTFWEKATILHQEANRPKDKSLPLRYSRHYYDLYQLSLSAYGERAMKDLDLLRDVVAYKNKFYHAGWASYDTAIPGSFKLLPPEHNLDALQQDYRDMQAMIFGEIPDFEDIIARLGELEERINSAAQPN